MRNVDVGAVNPRLVLLGIAGDASAPATARVAACKALLSEGEPTNSHEDLDSVAQLALRLLKGKK